MTSRIFAPASTSRSTPMICSSVNRLFRMRPPSGGLSQRLAQFPGGRSEPRASDAPSMPRPPSFRASIAPDTIAPMHLLLLEDDRATADALRVGLQRSGFTVTWAATADDAKRTVASERFDAVILDVMVPTGSGYDVLR